MSESVAAEHDYIGLSATTKMSEKAEEVLNFKATELRLGLPGSESPERVDPGFLSLKSSCPVSGAKRGFSDAINGSNKWVFSSASTLANTCDLGSGSGPVNSAVKDVKSTPFTTPVSPVKGKKSSATAPASK